MIYFIESRRAKAIKIGLARDPEKRLRTLQTASPTKLRLIATCPGGPREEMLMHRRFASIRLRGEWFRATRELYEFASGCNAGRHRAYRPHPGPNHPQYRAHCEPIEARVGEAVGFPVMAYYGLEPYITGADDRRFSFQVMPIDDRVAMDVEAFWGWHLDNNPQWFATVDEAGDEYIRCFHFWIEHVAGDSKAKTTAE